MLSVLSNISNKIRDFVKRRRLRRRERQRDYAVVIEDNIMTVENTYDETPSAPPPSPVTTRKLFNTNVDVALIKHDYELQDLLKMMDIHQIDISTVQLEERFETALSNDTRMKNDTIAKIKMKLLYIIIANNLYRTMFEEKKQYRSTRTDQFIGVFRYNDYIIRIDDCPYSFINERTVINEMLATQDTGDTGDTGDGSDAVIRPFLLYVNTRYYKETYDVCECRSTKCDCDYIDDAEKEFSHIHDDGNSDGIARRCFNKLRKNTISFSIQYYVKDTVSLYTWVKENLSSDVYNQFASIQRAFFIHLFHRCARLLSIIHRAGIVHGDIKPDNILIREDSNFNINHPERCKNFKVYLIDFGLSGKHKIGVGTGGTVPYCHPEFKNINDTTKFSKYNWKLLDTKHDVWSLGILFMTMYIYRDIYSYYYKYPTYFFLKDGYIAALMFDIITDAKINKLFTKMMTTDCIPSKDVCEILEDMLMEIS